jgi:transposase
VVQELFVAGSTARAAAELEGIQANIAVAYFMRLRKRITRKLPSCEPSGEFKADESYLGGLSKAGAGAAPEARLWYLACYRGSERSTRGSF